MRRVRHAVIVGSICATLLLPASGSLPASRAGAAAAATVTQDAVIAPDTAPNAVDDQVVMAGTTGFLHQFNFGGQYLWTDYATGHTVTVPDLTNVAFKPAGGDSVAVTATAAVNPAGDVSELDLSTMTWRHWAVPAGDSVAAVAGNSALVRASVGGTPTVQVLTFAADGSATATTVTGVPAGAVFESPPPGLADAAAMVVPYVASNVVNYGLLNLATAAMSPIPGATGSRPVALTADRVAFYTSATETVSVYSRAGLLAGAGSTPQTVTLPGATGSYATALAGDHVLAVPGTGECLHCAYTVKPVLDVPLSGAASGQALSQAQTGGGAIAQAPDGSALVVGGTGPADWSVRRLSTDSADSVTDTPVLALTGPQANAGLSISDGLVRHIQAQPVPGGAPSYRVFNHLLVPWNDGVPGHPALDGGPLAAPLPCAAGASCVLAIDGNGYGLSYLGADTATSITLHELIDANTSTMSNSLPSAAGTLVDAGLGYVIVDGVNPAHQYVVDVGHEKILSTGPVTGAGLWFDTLWRTAGAGLLRATDLDLGATSAPVSTGASCAATEVQVTRRWVYWSCGATGPAGVYDQWTKSHFAVPAGPMLLGDGYLVRHDAATGALIMYDIQADGVAAPVTLATVPAGPAPDDRGITWAVDKYSGDVAYVAADDSVHVLNVGVPASAPKVAYPPAPWLSVQAFSPAKNAGWSQPLVLSRPVTSWQLIIRKAGTSTVVRTQSGGAATIAHPTWNGYLPNGTKAYSGRYTWSLSVLTPGATTPVTVPGGTLVVDCGQLPFRSYDCGGEPALLRDSGGYAGQSHWMNGTPSGGFADNGYTDQWPLCSSSFCDSAIVPFGDLNSDGYGDLLVRTRDGRLHGYLGFGQSYFNGVKSLSLGSGWNAYNALAYPGDLNRDGHPDLVARDSAGRLWLYAGNGNGGFRPRVEISAGWGGYVRLVGAGDLTGDGVGDLLAIDKAGVMWLLPGNWHGGFLKRHEVSSGWSGYNAVIGIGELSVDGCNDLVARDTHGTLWRFNGNCKGGFSARVKISTGWGKYPGLF